MRYSLADWVKAHGSWNKGKHLSEEHRTHLKENHRGFTGLRHSEGTKEKLRQVPRWLRSKAERASSTKFDKGNVPWNKGIPCSEETRQKISLASRGVPWSAKTRKVLLPWITKLGKTPLSSEARQKLSQALIGRRLSKETKEKIRRARALQTSPMKGKTHSEEAKRKNSLAHKGQSSWNKGLKGLFHWSEEEKERRRAYQHTEEAKEKIRLHRATQYFPFVNTKIEVALQRGLQEEGIFFEVDKRALPGSPDLFIAPDICVFADGDYWHKLPGAAKRDMMATAELKRQGFKVFRFWEHEIREDVASCIQKICGAAR